VTVTRLVGGLTPGDGSDPRTFPAIWNATADVIDAQDSAISALEADVLPTSIGTAVAGQKLVFDGTNWVNLTGYVFVETVYFTSSGTFSKATYPWLRAIRVRCQGAGGGGGGCPTTGAGEIAVGGSGGGGAYAESFITNIAGLASSVTVTRGSGGAGGGAGANAGSAGGTSSFGSLVSANGGAQGAAGVADTVPVTITNAVASVKTATGDFTVPGGAVSALTLTKNDRAFSPISGGTFFVPAGEVTVNFFSGANGVSGVSGGNGGSGGVNSQNQGTNRSGGAGGNGIVIVELYA
jgi:hypothetical protein